MDEKKAPEIPKVKPNRKPLFIIGLVFGVLLGALLTMLVVDWLHYRLPKTVQVNSDATRREAVSDTVVNYVIHKYERDQGMNQTDRYGDVAEADSLCLEDESEDLMMDEDELEEVDEMEHQVQRNQMLWKENVWVVYLNDEKEERTGESVMYIQVKGWDTPIKNETFQKTVSQIKLNNNFVT